MKKLLFTLQYDYGNQGASSIIGSELSSNLDFKLPEMGTDPLSPFISTPKASRGGSDLNRSN